MTGGRRGVPVDPDPGRDTSTGRGPGGPPGLVVRRGVTVVVGVVGAVCVVWLVLSLPLGILLGRTLHRADVAGLPARGEPVADLPRLALG